MPTTCNYRSGSNAWTISKVSDVTFSIVKAEDDARPMVKIYINGSEQQCVPAETKRIWYATKESDVLKFKDVPDINNIGNCGAPVFCFKYTGQEDIITLRLEEHSGSGKETIFICRDDIRNGSAGPLTDHLFNIHNNSNVNTNSVRIMIREAATDNFDFVVTHMSGQPTTSLPTCDTNLPNPACKKVV